MSPHAALNWCSRLFVPIAAILCGASAPPTKLLRFPDVHGESVVFTYAGDLWRAPSTGGMASRLTAHPGMELFAKFSPDGQWIAFTGQYDGDEQVYVIPATGGVPKQLTWYPARGPLSPRWGYDNQVYGWTNDGQAVMFRSMRDGWSLTDTHLYTVPLDGGLPAMLPMPVSGAGDYSPGGTQVVYSPLTRDFRTWKRYQGGWAQDLYIYDLATAKLEPVAHSARTERDPMWIKNRIYFASDRDGTLNLFAYDLESKKVDQLTQSKTWDVRWPSKGDDGQIVYELDGELWIYDTKTAGSRPKQLAITVPNDGLAMRPSRIAVSDNIEGFALSPKGERALIVARGDVFTVPIEKGSPRNLTHTSNAHDRGATWTPDGSKVVFISDASGEEELYSIAQDGSGKMEALTQGSKARLTGVSIAPDGKRLFFTDCTGRLFVMSMETKAFKEVARDPQGNVGDATWSADGQYIAFSLSEESGFRSLYIWSAGDEKSRRITGEMFNEIEPVWDPNGNYLYYFSDREYAPQLSGAEWNFATNRTTCIFALALRKDVKHPFPPESDEVTIAKADGTDGEKAAEKDTEKDAKKDSKDGEKDAKSGDKVDAADAKPKEPIRIDFDGLAERVARVPVEADNYSGLTATKDSLIYTKGGPGYYGRSSGVSTSLVVYSIKDRKATTVVDDMGGYTLCSEGTKVLVREGPALNLYDATPKGKDSKKTVSTSGLFVDRVPKEEWVQIFNEVWRRFRDYFYVPNMHGYDWEGLRRQYATLLEDVAHRSDLNYVMGEMVSELNVGHAYIAGGDFEIPPRPPVALFGGRLELDQASGRYKIAKIFRGQNEENLYRSPLTEIGIEVKVGDFVLEIDGEELKAPENPYRLLRDKVDRPVEFTVNSRPDLEGSRKITFRPIGSEESLLYLDYVETARERVDRLTNGRVGYLHLPNMGADGIREFIKWFYGQVKKEGLVIDVRNNGGGNVSQMVLERLRRTVLGTAYSRYNDFTGTYPYTVFNGPMSCILDENSASDGDIFPWMFKTSKLGPLVGKRSWGGVVGITDHGPLIDGGSCNVPEFGHADQNGQWAVEGHGVDPDIVVDNDPQSVIEGRDKQLERAVEEVMKQLRENPRKLPARPADPVKTK
jgi:tricorn protease